MDNNPASGGNFAASLIIFALTAVMAIMLLATALVIWLSKLMGSFTLAALVVGGFFAVLSISTYLLVIRKTMAQIRMQVETIYEVAHMVKQGYEWVTDKIELVRRLLGK